MQVPSPIDEHMPLEEARRRLRWRARRGLLENDLFLQRFLATHGEALDHRRIQILMDLLEMPDNDLLDLLMGRTQPENASPLLGELVGQIRESMHHR